MNRPSKSAQGEIEALKQRVGELEAAASEHKRFEDAFRESEGKLGALLESASEGILIVDRQGRVVLVNARLEAMFGYDRAELLGQPLEVLVPESLRGVHVAHREGYFANPHVRPMGRGLDLAGRRRDGTEFPVEISLSYSDTGSGTLFMGFVTDITERRRAHEALLRRESLARAILESASEAIVIVDAQGMIVTVNAMTEAMFGSRRAELLGQPLESLLPERLRSRHADHRQGFVREPRVRPMGGGLDLVARRSDGSEFPVEISLSYVQTDDGLRAIAFVTDITQRQAMERATRQAERLSALGRLAAGIAHEINNPIGIMTSRIELMLMDAEANGLPAETIEDLRVVHRNAMRVATLARNLLSFAREAPRERRPVDLNEVVGNVLLLVRKEFGRQDIRILSELHTPLPPVHGQGNALEQVLLNLLTNAAEAMTERGEIRVTTAVADGRVRLTVADTGQGIAPEQLAHIFEPFFTTKPSGTGLGLSVTYGIVEDHGGTIDVESTPGQGTRFSLTFPVATP